VTLEEHCPACGSPFKSDAAFCASCGRRRNFVDRGLSFVIWFYLALLGVQVIALIAVRAGGRLFDVLAFATLGLSVVILAVAAVRWRLVATPYRRAGFSVAGYGLILLAAPAILLVVSAYVDALACAFGLHSPSELAGFEHKSLAWVLLLVAIAPPLTEELAFRGLIVGALTRSLRRSEIYILSSCAFAILHLSVPILLTHMPLGLYFCWLRERSGSLWPSTFAHFCHNLGVILITVYAGG
jgi:membrane protease YdiL (CAAX protease family)